MEIQPIKNVKSYNKALKEIERLWDSSPNTPDGDKLEVWVTLVEAYEEKKYKIAPPDPIESIKFRMEQMGLQQSDLAEILGGQNRVSEILNRKRNLTVNMMRKLHKKFKVPAESLLG